MLTPILPVPDGDTHIMPIRQGQLKERLGVRFQELDVPLLVEWPDGPREAILCMFEGDIDASRFSVHRLTHLICHRSGLP